MVAPFGSSSFSSDDESTPPFSPDVPAPLPKHPLTPPSAGAELERHQHTSEQRQSPLFSRLPSEVRLLIWEEYLCGHRLHIVRKARHPNQGRLVGLTCTKDPDIFPCTHICSGKPIADVEQFLQSTIEEVSFVALLRTCRLIYSEAVDLIYKHNMFWFEDIDSIMRLSQSVLPRRLNLIRSVRLTFHFPYHDSYYRFDYDSYVRTCHVLANMHNLEDLSIHLHPREMWATTTRNKLNPLCQIRQPNKFEVHLLLPPSYQQDISPPPNPPFRLIMHHVPNVEFGDCGKRRLRQKLFLFLTN